MFKAKKIIKFNIMEPMKFKVGDKVRVKSLEWYSNNKNINEEIIAKEGKKFGVFTKYMRPWCGDVIKINSVINGSYRANNCWRWYDWMLEDEVVKEEKQEIEQLNKNDMETKETKEQTKEQKVLEVRNKIAEARFQPIKKEEAEKLFIGTKFFCVNNEEAEKLQRKLFECGCRWSDIGDNIDVNRWAILVCGGGMLTHYNKEAVSWSDDSYIAILAEDVLAIQIEEEKKPKFNPQTLEEFQKVLYRSSNADWWRLGFFDTYNEMQNKKFWVIGQDVQPYQQCVPYNDETEHLKGQCLDAPAFYKNW